jgi:hypothetical protein
MRAEMTGVENLGRSFRRDRKLIRVHTRRALSKRARRIISDIRRDEELFSNESGRLKASLWTKRAKGTEIVQEMGWAVPYGEVLEFGPRHKREWKIRPRGFRSDVTLGRSGGGQALKALRFKSKGKIVYARVVTHRWTSDQLRPHFGPWLDHWRRHILAELATIQQRVIEGELT